MGAICSLPSDEVLVKVFRGAAALTGISGDGRLERVESGRAEEKPGVVVGWEDGTQSRSGGASASQRILGCRGRNSGVRIFTNRFTA